MSRWRSKFRRVAAAAAVVAAGFAASAGLARPPPVEAQVCVTVTVYQAGTPTTWSECRPLLDQFPPRCVEPKAVSGGYGVIAEVCVPSPPVQPQ